jgi:hypothetical protein
MKITDSLISARFLSTFGHLTALLILFQTIENNVEVSLPDGSAAVKAAEISSARGCLAFGCVCFLFDFSGMFFGNSLFVPSMNLAHVFFHAVGSILLSWLITQNWDVSALWPIVLCTNLPTAILELGIIFAMYVLKVVVR